MACFPGLGLVSSGSSQRLPLLPRAARQPAPHQGWQRRSRAQALQDAGSVSSWAPVGRHGSNTRFACLCMQAVSLCAVSKGCFASIAKMEKKAKIKKHPPPPRPPSGTAANTSSCKSPCNGHRCVDLTSPVDWVSACQAGHWISRKPRDEAGSFAPSLWPDAIRHCAVDKDHDRRPPCTAPGEEQKPLIKQSCCCRGEKRARHPHPEPQAAK